MADSLNTEYDKRQYKLMLDNINMFNQGRLNLASLISQLKALISVLKSADPIWTEDFISEWGTLEVIHAMELESMEIAPISEKIYMPNHEGVSKVIKNLEQLLSIVLTNASNPSSTYPE